MIDRRITRIVFFASTVLIAIVANCQANEAKQHTNITQIKALSPAVKITENNTNKPIIEGQPRFLLVFAPDYVACDIPRRFSVEIESKKAIEDIELQYDKSIVRLLDSNELESKLKENLSASPSIRYLKRFYFETIKSSQLTQIKLSDAGGSVVIPITVWDYDDLRTVKEVAGTVLPRRYPLGSSLPYIKTKQIFPSKDKGYKTDPVQVNGFIKSRTYFEDEFDLCDFTFDEFWKITPDCSLAMRRNHPAPPDPIHGKEVFQKAGNAFYAYYMTLAKPGSVDEYYLVSPIDKRKIPSNDYVAGDYSSGEFVDDAVNGIEYNGDQNHFLSQYIVFRSLQAYDMIAQAAKLYESTGEEKYLQLALIGYCRLGVEHNYLSVMLNHRRGHFNKFEDHTLFKVAQKPSYMGNCGFLIDGIWTTGNMQEIIEGYDKIFAGIKDDKKLFSFLQSKGFDIDSKEKLQRFIEENVFLTYFQAMLDGSQEQNFPGTQLTILKLIRMLDYPIDEFVDIVYEGDGNYLVNGLVTPLFMAQHFRDGIKGESLNGYNKGSIKDIYSIYSEVDKILNDSSRRYDIRKYPPPTRNKKFIAALESQIQHSTTPYTSINLGDAGTLEGYRRYYDRNKWFETSNTKDFFGDETYQLFNDLYPTFREPRLAWAMVNSENWKLPKNYPISLKQIEANAARLPEDWRQNPAVLSGPGITILRNGKDENERALYTHYSNFFSHAQDGTMGIFIDAFKGRIVSNWGYPEAWDRWYYCWFTQNTGRQYPISKNTKGYFYSTKLEGYNELAAKSGMFSVSDNKAEIVYDNGSDFDAEKTNGNRYEILEGSQRRINFMVEVSDTEFYTIDAYNIAGGSNHWRTFHTLDGTVETKGLDLTKQIGGTLAGKDVEYDDIQWVRNFAKQGREASDLMYGIGFVRLTNIERATIFDNNPFEVVWNINESDGLKLKLWSIDSGNAEIVLADAKEPRGSRPIVRRMLLWHHQGEEGFDSQVVNVFEGYRNAPVINSARKLEVLGESSDDFKPVGLEVKLSNRTDYIIISASQSKKIMRLPNGKTMTLEGRIGAVSFGSNNTIISQNLIGAKALQIDDKQIKATQAVYEAKITECNYPNWSITLSPQFNSPNELINKIMHIKRGGITIPLEIRQARNINSQTIVTVNCDPLLYTFKCRKIEDNKLVYKDFNDYAKWDFGRTEARLSQRRYFHRTSLFDDDGTQYKLETLGRGQVRFAKDQSTGYDALTEKFVIGKMINVYDYGLGDDVYVILEKSTKK